MARSELDGVYREWSPRVYAFLLRMTQNRALADDLFQETWLRAASAFERRNADVPVGAWLYTIARNLFVSHRRWQLVDFDRLSSLAFNTESVNTSTPLELLDASETRCRLERALGELPVAFREALILVDVQELDAKEASAVLGVSHDAMRQRLTRARKALAAVLEQAIEHAEAVPTKGAAS